MLTVWMNAYNPSADYGQGNVFQTWYVVCHRWVLGCACACRCGFGCGYGCGICYPVREAGLCRDAQREVKM
jgi:hypothetical protein